LGNIIALKPVELELSDAVRIAEKAAEGSALKVQPGYTTNRTRNWILATGCYAPTAVIRALALANYSSSNSRKSLIRSNGFASRLPI
jgi:hypothetical protein